MNLLLLDLFVFFTIYLPTRLKIMAQLFASIDHKMALPLVFSLNTSSKKKIQV